MITYKGDIRPSIAVVKIHEDGQKCRVAVVRSMDYGGIESCTEWLRERKGTIIELYRDSDDKSKRGKNKRNYGMAVVELIKTV